MFQFRLKQYERIITASREKRFFLPGGKTAGHKNGEGI